MNTTKLIYYGFGGFIGFICGTVLNLIFYWVDQSGAPLFTILIKDFGVVGRYLVELVNYLPFFGLALGIIMVKLLFKSEIDKTT